jgi:hypothetical protein
MTKLMDLTFKTFWTGTLAILLAAGMVHASPIPLQSRQALVVKADTWDSPQATLQRYTRVTKTKGKSIWRPVGKSIAVVLGKGDI